MINHQRIEVDGKRFVLVNETDYERLCRQASREIGPDDLPDLPKADRHGRVPALLYARISLARDLIRARKAAGLTQQRLAQLAAVRQETLSRLESGKHTPSARTVERITRAIELQQRKRKRRRAA